jgi:hypothetical protein
VPDPECLDSRLGAVGPDMMGLGQRMVNTWRAGGPPLAALRLCIVRASDDRLSRVDQRQLHHKARGWGIRVQIKLTVKGLHDSLRPAQA